MSKKTTYKGKDLREISQNDLAKLLNISPVLVSFETELSEEDMRVSELFTFAEHHNLSDLSDLLDTIY